MGSKSTGLLEIVLISRAKFQVKANYSNMPGFEKSEGDRAFNRHLRKLGSRFKTWEWDLWSIWTNKDLSLISSGLGSCPCSLHLCCALFHRPIIHQGLRHFKHILKFECIRSPAEIILFWWQEPVFWAKKNEQGWKNNAFYDLKHFSSYAVF